MENSVAVYSPTKFHEGQTHFIISLQGWWYSSCPQGANILIGKTPKNKSQNQISASIEVYTKHCKSTEEEGFFFFS